MFKLKSFNKKIFFGYFVFSFFLVFSGLHFCLAESNNLGNFSGTQFSAKFQGGLTLKAGDFSYTLSPAEISSWLKSQEILVFNPHYSSEIENPNLCQSEKSLACALSFSVRDKKHIQKISHLSVDVDLLKKFIADLSRQANKDPVDAKFQMTDGRIQAFSLSSDGLALDEIKSFQVILDYLQSKSVALEIDLPYQNIKPEVGTDSIQNMGITSLVGEGHSDFKGSPKNRVSNINVGASRFNGVLIKPGEEFSFVKTLGPVDAEHGYLPELVIKQNATEPEFGGGMCQVSTTAFRAAIYSGLKITARQNHAYPVSYYNPQGMDSTVYIPRPDLKFINNTPGYILIQTKIVGTQLFFDFYGTDDGRKTNVIGPTITERGTDGSLKATFTQQVFNKDNAMFINDVFNSKYNSPNNYPHPGQILTDKPADWSDKQWKDYKKANKP